MTGGAALRGFVFIGLAAFLFQIAPILTIEKLQFLYKDELHLSAGGAASIAILLSITSFFRPIMGLGVDLYPLFGSHRRSYFILGCLLEAAALTALALLPHYSFLAVAALLFARSTGAALFLVMISAALAEIGNSTGTQGRLVSLNFTIPMVMGLTFAGPLSGYVTQHWSYQACFFAGATGAAAVALLAGLMPESESRRAHSPEERRREQGETLAILRRTMTPVFIVLIAFIIYVSLTPGFSTARFYYNVDALHLSKQTIGNLRIPSSLGGLVAVLAFGIASKRLPVSFLVWGTIAGKCLEYAVSFFMRDLQSAYAVTLFADFSQSLQGICLITLAIRAAPKGIEATIMGLIFGLFAVGAAFSEKIGSEIYDWFGPAHGYSVAHGWSILLATGLAFTLAAVAFVPFLPSWTRAHERLEEPVSP